MSYSNSSTNSLRSPVAPGDSAGYDRFIDQQVAKTGSQVKLVDICSSLMVLGAGVLSFLLIVTVLDHWVVSLGTGGRWAALALLACGAGWYLVRVLLPVLFGRVNPLFAARTIEHSEPSLKNSLINFLLFRSDRAGVRAGVYQALEQRAAVDLSHVPVDTAVDRSRLIKIGYVLAGVLAVCAAYTILAPKSPFQSVARILAPWADIERPSRVRIEEVQPGNVEVFQGERIAVSADCYDLRRDEPVTVHYTTLDEQRGRQSATMQPVAGNLRHECRLPIDDEGFQRDVMYWLEAGDARTPAYRVRVVPAPVILVESIEYEYPPYTKLPKRVVERQGDIKAVEGTRITVRARANQPILAAVLEFDPPAQDAESTSAAAGSSYSGPLATSAYRIEMEFREQEAWCSFVGELEERRKEPKHRTYQLRFSTQGGHRNPQPVLHRLEVLRDLPPEVEILTPVQDRVEVPEDGWQKIEIRGVDPDFGLTAIRLEAVAGGRQVLKRDLLQDPAGRSGQEIAGFDFAPQACGMRAGTEAKCWAVAEDNRTAPKTGSPEPNVVKSRELTLVVTRPAAPAPPDQAAEKQEPASKPAAGQPKDDAGGPPPPGGQPSQDSQPPSSAQESPETGQGQQDQGSAAKQPSGAGEGSSGSGQQGGQSNQTSQSGGTGGNADSSSSQSDAGSPPDGGNMQADGNSESSSGTDGSQGGEGSASSQPEASGSQSGSPGGSNSSAGSDGGEGQSAEPLHDGDAFEQTMEHMQQAAKGEAPKDASSGGAGSQAGDQGGQKPASAQGQDASQQASSSGAGKPSKSEPNGQPQPATGAGQTGSHNEPQSPKPDESPAGASGQPGGAAKQSPGQPPADKSQGAGQSQQGSSGSDATPQGPTEQQGGEPKQSPSGSGQQKEPGQSEGGQSGSGQPNESRGGSASGQNPEGTSQKQPSSGGGEPRPSQEPQSPSMSRKAGGAQGDAGGDQSGGGKQGGGQGGKQPGNDKPGGTSPGDQGSGAAQESGQGDLAQRPGDKQESQERTGASGYDSGAGTKSKPAAEGTAGAGAQGESAHGGPSPSVPKTPTDGAPSESGQGLPLGGGAPSSAELQGGNVGGEVPPGEQPNLEYARKATDLVLEYLKDQQSDPDEDLLKKLGWTKEDLEDFVRRWADLKRTAREDPRARQQLDDALRSLGLRPAARDPRRSDVRQDTRQTERNLGDRSRPPSAYSELFDAYRKGTGRTGER